MTAITTTAAFQERMFEKIRDQMGDLLTEEDLKRLVESAMQKAFFEPRTDARGYNTGPPLFVSMIEKQMQQAVSKAVSDWVAAHPEEVAKVLKETIEAGIFNMMISHFASRTSWPLQELLNKLQSKGIL